MGKWVKEIFGRERKRNIFDYIIYCIILRKQKEKARIRGEL